VQVLDLAMNQLSGTIPSLLSTLAAATVISLDGNALTGTVPSEFSRLSALTSLSLQNNHLSGVSAGTLAGMVSLKTLDINSNGLSQSAVDDIVNQIYQARDSYNNAVAKTLDLGGSNAAPSATAISQIQTLKNATYKWTITCASGC
jgi:Leucine-rich repeat (LRR) protein